MATLWNLPSQKCCLMYHLSFAPLKSESKEPVAWTYTLRCRYNTVNFLPNDPHNRHDIARRSLRWRHNGCNGVSNHQPHDCLLNYLFRRRSKKTSKLRVTGLCAGNSPGTGELPAQMASNAENVSISWRHHVRAIYQLSVFRCKCNLRSATVITVSHFSLHALISAGFR